MAGPRGMASFAGDVELGPGGLVAVRGCLVSLAQSCRVALRAHRVPTLVGAGPVERIARRDLLVRIEMEPAPPSPLGGPAVPGPAQRLQPAAGKLDEVLLQRLDTEGVADRQILDALRTLDADGEALALANRDRGLPGVDERPSVEAAEDGPRRRLLHGEIVVRSLPEPVLLRMATRAGLPAHIGRGGGRGGWNRRLLRPWSAGGEAQTDEDFEESSRHELLPPARWPCLFVDHSGSGISGAAIARGGEKPIWSKKWDSKGTWKTEAS